MKDLEEANEISVEHLRVLSQELNMQTKRANKRTKDCDIRGAKELGVIYFPTNWRAKKEPPKIFQIIG